MPDDLILRFATEASAVVVAHTEELTSLDQAIGDGDHGLNMKRGFEAVAAARGKLAEMGFADALNQIGTTLVMTIGGASGPLYGSLFLAMAKTAGAAPPREAATIAALLDEGIEAVKKRGRSTTGEKTMLDVLVPVAEAVHAASGADPAAAVAAVRRAADAGLESTRPLRATKGRASFLGGRSIGHLDPGARSSHLLVHAVCDIIVSDGARGRA